MAITINQKTSAGEDVEKWEPFCTVGGNADWCSHYRKQCGDISKIENGSAFWPSNPISGNISKKPQNNNLKEHKHPYDHCHIIYNHQDIEAAQVSTSRWVDKKLWYIYAMEYYLAIKKDVVPFG